MAPGRTNEAITGENTEDKVAYEGTVYFDAISNMIKRLQLSFEEACDILQVNPEDYMELKSALE